MPIQGGAPVLELTDVHKRYGKVPALSGLGLSLGRGDVYGFLGRNGAGKSTTLRIVMGITRHDRGQVALFGSAASPSDVRPRQRIGYVAQEQHFYAWMTPESLGRFVGAFYPSWDPAYFARLTRSFDVPPRKIGTFSGGTKVKLALALALAHRPELLVLDEPTAGLDAVVRREFAEIVRELMQSGEHATLFSSHLIDEVEAVASRVGIIEQGKMRYEGSLSELSTRVLCLSFDAAALAELLAATQTQEPSQAWSQLLGTLPVRPLRRRDRNGGSELTLWLDDPALGAEVKARLSSAQQMPLSLADCFIEIVRQGSGWDAASLPAAALGGP